MSARHRNILAATLALLAFLVLFQNCGDGFSALSPAQLVGSSSSPQLNSCSAAESRACETVEGTGVQTCQSSGQFGACALEACKPGYLMSGNQCLPAACTPATSMMCAEGNGSGQKTCALDGSGYGACVLNACNAGFDLRDGACVSNTCMPNTTMACTERNGSGLRTCDAQGAGYGGCVLNACNPGYALENNSCVGACTAGTTMVCAENNGSGLATCNSQGTGYGACQLNACNSGYRFESGVCLIMSCVPNQQVKCLVPNGEGTATCNAQGNYGACLAVSCISGFVLSSGQCISGANPTLTILPATVKHDASQTLNEYGAYSPLGDVSGELNFTVPPGTHFSPNLSIGITALNDSNKVMTQVNGAIWLPTIPPDGRIKLSYKVLMGGSFLPKGRYRLAIRAQAIDYQTNYYQYYTNIALENLPAPVVLTYSGGQTATYYVVGEFDVIAP